MTSKTLHDLNNKIYKSNIGQQKDLDKLREDYLRFTATSSHVPVSWAKEAYVFLEKIDKKYGFVYEYHNEKILNPKLHNNSFFLFIHVIKELFINPILLKVRIKEVEVKHIPLRKPEKIDFSNAAEQEILKYNKMLENYIKLKKRIEEKKTKARKDSFSIAWKKFLNELPKYRKNVLTNLFHKTPIVLGQFKEKFAYVTFYKIILTKDEELKKEIEEYINKLEVDLEIDLSLKGVYLDINILKKEEPYASVLAKRNKDKNKKDFMDSL